MARTTPDHAQTLDAAHATRKLRNGLISLFLLAALVVGFATSGC
jgi:hypothetical protein